MHFEFFYRLEMPWTIFLRARDTFKRNFPEQEMHSRQNFAEEEVRLETCFEEILRDNDVFEAIFPGLENRAYFKNR